MTKFLDTSNFINKAMGFAFVIIGIIGYFQVDEKFGINMILLGFFQFGTVLIYNWSKKMKEKYEQEGRK